MFMVQRSIKLGIQKVYSTYSLMKHADSLVDKNDPALSVSDYFGLKSSVTLRDLFESRVHLGHKVSVRNEQMLPFIFGSRLDCDIIDLDQTLPLLHDALNFTAHISRLGGIILLVSRHAATIPLIESMAIECTEYSHCRHWWQGTFTNAHIHFKHVTRLPDLVIFFSTMDRCFQQHLGVIEAAKMNIPTIGIVDTNCDPRLITYPVPANDDSPQSHQLYAKLFKNAILKGKNSSSQNPNS